MLAKYFTPKIKIKIFVFERFLHFPQLSWFAPRKTVTLQGAQHAEKAEKRHVLRTLAENSKKQCIFC